MKGARTPRCYSPFLFERAISRQARAGGSRLSSKAKRARSASRKESRGGDSAETAPVVRAVCAARKKPSEGGGKSEEGESAHPVPGKAASASFRAASLRDSRGPSTARKSLPPASTRPSVSNPPSIPAQAAPSFFSKSFRAFRLAPLGPWMHGFPDRSARTSISGKPKPEASLVAEKRARLKRASFRASLPGGTRARTVKNSRDVFKATWP